MKFNRESPEFQLLLQSVRLDDSVNAIKEGGRIISSNIINWDDLYLRAELHSVRPQLALLMNKVTNDHVPAGFREKLNKRYLANLYDQISYAAEFLQIRKMLDDTGIMAVPFKGFWLAHEMYGNLADRESMDIDLFIHLHDLDRIMALMPLMGYRAETSSSPEFIEKEKKV